MYTNLARKIHGREASRAGQGAPKGLYQWDVFRMATSGEYIPIDTAIAIRDCYFPGEPLEDIFKRDDNACALTVAEAGHIMRHTMPGEVMGDMQNAVFRHVNNVVELLPASRGVVFAMGWCLAIGRAAGIKEERARGKEAAE